MEAVNSSTTLVDAYKTTQHPLPDHNVVANLLANYALESKVNNTQNMERLFDRINVNGMVYHHDCCIKRQTLVNRMVKSAKT